MTTARCKQRSITSLHSAEARSKSYPARTSCATHCIFAAISQSEDRVKIPHCGRQMALRPHFFSTGILAKNRSPSKIPMDSKGAMASASRMITAVDFTPLSAPFSGKRTKPSVSMCPWGAIISSPAMRALQLPFRSSAATTSKMPRSKI